MTTKIAEVVSAGQALADEVLEARVAKLEHANGNLRAWLRLAALGALTPAERAVAVQLAREEP